MNEINKLIDNNSTLVNTNAELAHVNKEAISMAKFNQELLNISYEIYQALDENKKRSILEEAWYRGLQELLIEKSKR